MVSYWDFISTLFYIYFTAYYQKETKILKDEWGREDMEEEGN